MKISVIHPSRGRAALAYEVIKKWSSSCKDILNIEYIISVDNDDPQLDQYMQFAKDGIHVVASDNTSCMEAVNSGAAAATGDIFLVNSDDFDCPLHWDALLIEGLSGKSDFVVKTDDGCQPWIMTMPLMDRVYYDRFGYIYNPAYRHMFADTEMTHIADLLDRAIYLPILFPHNHYTTGANAKDALNVRNDKTWQQGEDLYLSRVKTNFRLTNFTGKLRCKSDHISFFKSKGIDILNLS